ncbi:MAG: fasciclin domain-containing protein [Chloroflexi bacterium]|nr:fasciclin domain-containing protein [Chloroflexota bacterium]
MSAAVLGPADVSFEAGRSYTLAAVGQRADLSLSPLVIDENLLLETYNIDPASSWVLLLHAVSGAPAVDVYFNDTLVVSGLGFGASLVAEATEASFQLRVTAAGQSGDILNQTLLGLPNNTQFVTVAGTADDFSVIVGSNSPLNAVDFLRGLSGQPTSFDTLLAAVDAAGLTDALANQGPFTLFAPPDSAFAALPAGTLEAALADPTLLTNILGYHVVPDYVTSADVVDELLTTGSVTLSTAQGGALTISSSDGRVLINGTAQILATDYYVRNGVIHVIDSLLVP